MHLITLQEWTTAQLEAIIDASIQIKQHPLQYGEALKHKKLYMLFEKTSTRTALGFGLGFNELGGTYFIQRWYESNFAVGDIADETRYVARNVDIILARLKHNKNIELMGKSSPIPVINGCCDKHHPTQALADCMAVKELFGTYQKTLLYIGIWNNTFNSLVASFPRLGGKLIGVCPIINTASVSQAELEASVKTTKNFEFYGRTDVSPAKLKELVDAADIVYTDTWVDMEFFDNPAYKDVKEERINTMKPFAVTADLLKSSHAKVMHDMPMHAGYEIERDVIEAHLETILHQAENRRHVAKGIFMHLLGQNI
jgi:ornithine carbamoyltransferase